MALLLRVQQQQQHDPLAVLSGRGGDSAGSAIGGILPDWCVIILTMAFTATLLCLLLIDQGQFYSLFIDSVGYLVGFQWIALCLN